MFPFYRYLSQFTQVEECYRFDYGHHFIGLEKFALNIWISIPIQSLKEKLFKVFKADENLKNDINN